MRVDGMRGTLVSSHTLKVAWLLALPPLVMTGLATLAMLTGYFWAVLFTPVITIAGLGGTTILAAGRPSGFQLGMEHVVLATRRIPVRRLVHAWVAPLDNDMEVEDPPVRHIAVRLRGPDEVVRIPANWHHRDDLRWLCQQLNELAERDIEAEQERAFEKAVRVTAEQLLGGRRLQSS